MTSQRFAVAFLSLTGALMFSGCGTSTPAAPGPGTDSGTATGCTAPAECMPTGIAAAEAAMGGLACVGMRTIPTLRAETDFTIRVETFQSKRPVANARVKFYPSNIVPADLSCVSPGCIMGTATLTTTQPINALATFRHRLGALYAYVIEPDETERTVRSIEFNNSVSASGTIDRAVAVEQATVDFIPALLQIDRMDGRGILAGRVFDCADEEKGNVANAVVHLFRSDGTLINETGTARNRLNAIRYFTGDVPNPSRKWTDMGGLYGVVNVDVPEDGLRAEAWAMRDGTYQRIGCEDVRLAAGAVTVINIGPLRSDYGADSKCATRR